MIQRYFIRVKFLPTYRNNALLAGRCIQILHGVLIQNGYQDIAISFPEWSSSSLGSSIAFISNIPKHLLLLLDHPFFKQMQSLGYFEMSPISMLLETSSQVIYYRDQGVDKSSASGARRRYRRLLRRAQQRGEVYSCKSSVYRRDVGHFHQVPISSRRTGQIFNLYIKQKKVPLCLEGVVTSYGLSSQSQNYISIPQIIT